ncbi:MAG: hypothetical protein JKY67_20360 [Pseudomonadales bacterium]|nr:hypothetical protein [Pseudomonadales bacterium]
MSSDNVSPLYDYFPTGSGTSGESEESKYVEQLVEDFACDASQANSINTKEKVIDELKQLYVDRSSPNWDAYDAAPLKAGALMNAVKFIQALKSVYPLPEISADPDGDISLEWIKKDKILSLSLGCTNIICYAAIYGENKKSDGVEIFDGDITEDLEYLVKRIYK